MYRPSSRTLFVTLGFLITLISCSSHVDKLSGGQTQPRTDGTGTPLTPAQKATFSWINANIIVPSCVGCHAPGKSASDYPFQSYDQITDPSNGVITKKNTEASFLYTDIRDGLMPRHKPHLPADQVQAVADWINNDCPND